MKLLKEYFKLQEEIYNYFEYVEDWVVIPLEDSTEYYWYLDGEDEVRFADTKENLINKENRGYYYVNSIYTQRFLTKWIYRAKDFTMMVVDTHTDGNKFLQVFDNSKEVKEIV